MANSVNTGKGSTILIDEDNIDETNVGFNAEVGGNAVAGIVSGGDTTVNYSVTTTDNGAVSGSFDLVRDALDFADDESDDAFALGRSALTFAGGAIDAIRDENDANRTFLRNENNSNRTFLGAAFDSGIAAANKAVDAVTSQANANRDALVRTQGDALGAITRFAGNTFDTLDEVLDDTLGTLGDAVGKVTDATTKQIGAFADATRSETAASFDKLVKYGAIAAVIITVAVVVTRKGSR